MLTLHLFWHAAVSIHTTSESASIAQSVTIVSAVHVLHASQLWSRAEIVILSTSLALVSNGSYVSCLGRSDISLHADHVIVNACNVS